MWHEWQKIKGWLCELGSSTSTDAQIHHPTVVIDGDPHECPWGEDFIPLESGPHQIGIFYRYLGGHAGKVSFGINVPPNEVIKRSYRAPNSVVIAFLLGKPTGGRPTSWKRHHIEVVRTAAAGNISRATDLLREHLASVGCDPLALRIVTGLRRRVGTLDGLEDLSAQLPGCHRARYVRTCHDSVADRATTVLPSLSGR